MIKNIMRLLVLNKKAGSYQRFPLGFGEPESDFCILIQEKKRGAKKWLHAIVIGFLLVESHATVPLSTIVEILSIRSQAGVDNKPIGLTMQI